MTRINNHRPSIAQRLRRRIPWHDWQAPDDLERLLAQLTAAREQSLEFEEAHRAQYPGDDHELAYSFDGEGMDRISLMLEHACARMREVRRQLWYTRVALAIAVANVLRLLW
jgi:hypothetical protein